ncbi:potassium channel subfamily K, other eukaryote [Marchantia polymorpha subsp. ruderalis]|uniref:Potassium channel domain-containing protein n=2 Tax=Marchantia polymorpha TaxID=3197 RepID=A0A176VB19_MARPO|nr:hypothetical protein AXG93_2899s1190 [Marchantia polymorpha subsp. ruderalis]PTQ36855.1 hypothetical protein MARPO_0061s0102 [Marchantia polymorpha]BBM99830.1 hypothetical protein Mp_1g24190 [Marchantia polymorpha subsp. ruderalis]|eukprot:PTQ36855.1 hypothetical protein MARPO_0061s0102 [Marchantia polymorpha]
MDEPLLGVADQSSMDHEYDHGAVSPIRIPSIRKSDHPTFNLISPRPRSSMGLSPVASSPDSLFRLFLDIGVGRRTEKFYVPPAYGSGESSRQNSSAAAAPAASSSYSSGLPSPGGTSLSSLFRIPEEATATGNERVTNLEPRDLEAAPPLGLLAEIPEWRSAESLSDSGTRAEHSAAGDLARPSVKDYYPVPDSEQTSPGPPPPSSQERRKLHKCNTAPVLSTVAVTSHNESKADPSEIFNRREPRDITAWGVVWQAAVGLLVYLFVGVLIYCWRKDEFKGVETVGVIDAIYFCIVTMCTIGYGDITPITPLAKMLSCCLVLVGFGFIDALMSGMVTFVLNRQESLLMNVVKDGHHNTAKSYVLNEQKQTLRIRLKVLLAVGTVLGSLAVGTVFLHYFERMSWIDSVYVTCISITTVGYGDFSFQTMWGRLFAAVWLLLSTLGVARAFLFLAEARVQRRHRHFARKMLRTKMSPYDVIAADIDNDGHVSVAEYVVYKLKAMKKINDRDIVDIVNQFNDLDTAGVGKITMTRLLEAESTDYKE